MDVDVNPAEIPASEALPSGEPAAARPKRVTRRRAQTRERLLDAALDVFAAHGLGTATVEEVCERAGFTRGAFYSNFHSLEELFFALYQRQSLLLVERARGIIMESVEAHDASVDTEADALIDTAVERFLATQSTSRGWWLVATEYLLYAARRPEAAARLAEYRREFRDQLTPLLTEGLARADRRLTIDVDDFVRLLIAVHEGGLGQSYLEPDAVPYGRIDRLAIPCLIRGLSTAG